MSGLAAAGPETPRGWWPAVGVVTLVGLAVRVAAVLARPHLAAGGDAGFYHREANLVAQGLGFINPAIYTATGQHVQTAAFPPLFTLVLAVASVVGLKSYLAQRLWCCVIGSAALPLAAVVGRRLGGGRVGLVAAALAAVYPNLWMSDSLGMSETLSPVLVLLVLWAAYRFWARPGVGAALALGASIGLAALGRDELALLGLFVLVPLAGLRRVGSGPRRLALLGAGVLAALLVVSPIVGYNLSRFQDPVTISDGLGVTLASANCATTYQGQLAGYWSMPCARAAPVTAGADESVQASEQQAFALKYVRAHQSELPLVLLEREGRAWGAYRPVQQVDLDAFLESRPKRWAFVGLGMYYGLALLAVGGLWSLRRRRVPVFPLLAIGADVVVSVALTFGQTRYRETFEVVLVLLAVVAVDAGWRAWRARRAPPPAAGRPVGLVPPRVLVVLPALDEGASVGAVVAATRATLPDAHVLVVDDGSSDDTASRAAAAGAEVLSSVANTGVGAAVRRGFAYALAHDFDVVARVDADGQHDPRDLPALLAALDPGGGAQLVVGNRFGPGASRRPSRAGAVRVGAVRRLAMWLLARAVSALVGTRLDDVTSGLRVHSRELIAPFAVEHPTAYLSDTVGSLLLAHGLGARVTQVPVVMRRRVAGASSQPTWRAVLSYLRVLAALAGASAAPVGHPKPASPAPAAAVESEQVAGPPASAPAGR